mgnify:CR=1 FL=1
MGWEGELSYFLFVISGNSLGELVSIHEGVLFEAWDSLGG